VKAASVVPLIQGRGCEVARGSNIKNNTEVSQFMLEQMGDTQCRIHCLFAEKSVETLLSFTVQVHHRSNKRAVKTYGCNRAEQRKLAAARQRVLKRPAGLHPRRVLRQV